MESKQHYNLTEGGILQKLLVISVPIIGTQIIQMIYNLSDMFWLGRLSSGAVAATGSVGMYLWMSMALLAFGAKGAEIGVSQNMGRGDATAAQKYGQSAVTLALLLGILTGGAMILFRHPLIGFFQIREQAVVDAAIEYLWLVAIGVPFSFVTAAINGIFNGSGNSRLPFYINTACLVINMILDPVMIIYMNMGVVGAAISTILAEILACFLMVLAIKYMPQRPFAKFRLSARLQLEHVRQIFKWVTPIAIESFLFTFMSMFMSRFIVSYGATALAVQKVGSQVESLSWLIAGGYSVALTSYIGQNYGGGKWRRIHRGFHISTAVMVIWGFVITAILFFGGKIIYRIFIPGDPAVAAMGDVFLKILAICQLPACLESIASGAFRGMGRTTPPSVVSITLNSLRVVAAWYLSSYTPLGLNGIFWALSVGAGLRGLWMYIWYCLLAKRLPRDDENTASGIFIFN